MEIAVNNKSITAPDYICYRVPSILQELILKHFNCGKWQCGGSCESRCHHSEGSSASDRAVFANIKSQ